jgi:hypothetical protein
MIRIGGLELLIGPRSQDNSQSSFPSPAPGSAETGGKVVLSQLRNANVVGAAEDAECVQKPHHDRNDYDEWRISK